MKNKTTLSFSIWLLVVFLSAFYFISQKNKEKKNNSAVEKSSQFLSRQSRFFFEYKLEELRSFMEESGEDPRDVSLYNSLKSNADFSDSLYQTNNYEWKYLKNHLRDSSYQSIISTQDKAVLNYQNKGSLLLNNFHKQTLYSIFTQTQILEFNRMSWQDIRYDELGMGFLPFNSTLPLQYFNESELQTSKIYQNNKPIENLYFDIEKDTIINFEVQTDYYLRDTIHGKKNYQLKIKAGQRNDFEIKEVK